MSQEITIPNTEVSFKDFLFKNKRNRTILWIAAAAIVIQFAVFKYFYPFASFIHADSFVYLDTAYHNLNINTYLIGYSRFLRLFSVFTNSDSALVFLQFLLLHASALLLTFTLFYLFHPSKPIQIALLCFMLINPLFLHLANLVSSDSLFLSLSLTWFSSLLWIIFKPNTHLIIINAILLFFLFTIRYNALIYPLISAVAFILSNFNKRKKAAGITLGIILCTLFVVYTSSKYKALTGIWQYSPFSGWQMANNAMYAYREVDSSNRRPVPHKFKALDIMVRNYFDTTRDILKHPQEIPIASTVYMWDPTSPLYKYQNKIFQKNTKASELKKWASMGPLYKSYGLYIIQQYPRYFSKHFIWPNATKYFALPVEFLRVYNSGKDTVPLIAQAWFNYKSKTVSTRMKDSAVNILNFYPILNGIMNVLLICTLLSFISFNGFKKDNHFKKGIILALFVWLCNAIFTIFASSAALRFQSFPLMLVTTFVFILIDWLCKKGIAIEKERQNASNNSTTLGLTSDIKVDYR